MSRGEGWKSCILFCSKVVLPEGEGRQRIETFARNGQRRAFTPAVILFIALAETEDNSEPG
jgi:hypothetical protein